MAFQSPVLLFGTSMRIVPANPRATKCCWCDSVGRDSPGLCCVVSPSRVEILPRKQIVLRKTVDFDCAFVCFSDFSVGNMLLRKLVDFVVCVCFADFSVGNILLHSRCRCRRGGVLPILVYSSVFSNRSYAHQGRGTWYHKRERFSLEVLI